MQSDQSSLNRCSLADRRTLTSLAPFFLLCFLLQFFLPPFCQSFIVVRTVCLVHSLYGSGSPLVGVAKWPPPLPIYPRVPSRNLPLRVFGPPSHAHLLAQWAEPTQVQQPPVLDGDLLGGDLGPSVGCQPVVFSPVTRGRARLFSHVRCVQVSLFRRR